MSSKVRYEDVHGVQVPRIDHSDPKRPDKVVPFNPELLGSEANSIELQSVAAMMLAGSAMVLRQKSAYVTLYGCSWLTFASEGCYAGSLSPPR
jgi:hypothetical protein